jgi:hypothetical protein
VVLTLIGDEVIDARSGDRVELGVRYQDEEGVALFGIVDFELLDDPQRSQLSTRAATTDSSGLARVSLYVYSDSGNAFRVQASALGGDPVTWDIYVVGQSGPLSPAGLYRLDSRFQLGAHLHEGTLSAALEGVAALEDEPGSYLLDRAAELGLISESQARTAGPDLDALLQFQSADDVAQLQALGRHVGDVSRGLTLISTLEVGGEPGARSAQHVLSGVVLSFADQRHALTLDDLGLSPGEATRLAFQMSGNDRVLLDEHALAIPYAALLEAALFEYVLPTLDGSGRNLISFFHQHYDCGLIADWMSMEFGMDPIVADGSCRDSVTAGADELAARIAALDAEPLELVIAGQAYPLDTTGDGRVDELAEGAWQGFVEHGGRVQATLMANENGFSAGRIGGSIE